MPNVNVTPANFDQVQMTALLANTEVRKYIRENRPSFKGTTDVYGQRYDLTWNNAITFSDGTQGSLTIHMHERVNDSSKLDGGGAWVDGGATGHGVNVDTISAIKKVCTEWINDQYEGEWTY